LPAAEEAVADSKSQSVLPPDLQTYLLLCLRMGLEGQRGRGLSNAATADSKQLVTDLVGKIDEMHKIVGKKKREDRLNDDEIRKLRDLAAGLETLIGHREDGVEGATEQARAN